MSRATPPTAARRRKLCSIGAGGVVLAVIAGLLIWLFAAQVIPDAAADASTARTDDAEAIMAAKMAVQTRVPDAQSITFGKVSVTWDGEDPAVCGMVDIVEDQDSFDGPERFIYLSGALDLEEVDGTDALTQKWDDACK